jgi:hypothetical protein
MSADTRHTETSSHTEPLRLGLAEFWIDSDGDLCIEVDGQETVRQWIGRPSGERLLAFLQEWLRNKSDEEVAK